MSAPKVTPHALEAFRQWLLDDGRSEGTARLYVLNVASCARTGDLTERLVDRSLAPKTLRTNLAALQRWADFTEDDALARRCKKIKLPAAVRLTPKKELPEAEWLTLIDAIREPEHRVSRKTSPAMRGILLMMALRGLRCGDVLRLRRIEIGDALRTGTLSYEAKGRRRLEYNASPIREPLALLAEATPPKNGAGGPWSLVDDLVIGRGPASLARRRRAALEVTRALARYGKRLGIEDLHPHRLRRTYAVGYLQLMHGDPQALLKLQAHMGWASMATAAGYVDAMNKLELDALGDALAKRLAKPPSPGDRG